MESDLLGSERIEADTMQEQTTKNKARGKVLPNSYVDRLRRSSTPTVPPLLSGLLERDLTYNGLLHRVYSRYRGTLDLTLESST